MNRFPDKRAARRGAGYLRARRQEDGRGRRAAGQGTASQGLCSGLTRVSESWFLPMMLRLGLTRLHRGHGPRFAVTKAQAPGRQVRRGMIERNHPGLSIGAQCRLLSIARSSFHCEPQGETKMNLALMLLIDRQFLETPFYGVRQMAWHLRNEGHAVNQKRIRRLMRLMGLIRSIRSPIPAGRPRGTRPIPTCWAVCGSSGPIRSGAPISPICRCAVGSSSSSPSWTGPPGRCRPGASPTRWRWPSASRR